MPFSIPGGSVAYDGNGNLTNDVAHTYSWDADGNIVSAGGGVNVTMIYDALDRMIEQTSSGTNHGQIVYGPRGQKLAMMNGQTFIKAFINPPGGAALSTTAVGCNSFGTLITWAVRASAPPPAAPNNSTWLSHPMVRITMFRGQLKVSTSPARTRTR